MDLSPDLQGLLVAAALGMLVGLQRQWANVRVAGIRTFALVTLLGAMTAHVGGDDGLWVVAAGLLALTALVVMGNVLDRELAGAGQTTEVAMLLMYLVGASVMVGSRSLGVIVGATVAVLLQMKDHFKVIVSRIGEDDLRAILQFVVISLIVLPVLPDRTFGPYQVLNPRTIWLMVVLIVGINLVGYGGHRLLGHRRGTVLAGVLGGLISSTATTASYARAPEPDSMKTRAATAVILLATAVVFLRVMIEVAAVSPPFLRHAVGPIAILLLAAAALGAWALRGTGSQESATVDKSNPSKLGPALFFALMYGVVLLAVAAAEDRLGGAGLYGVAALSGLTDMDAITLSTSELVSTGRVEAATGWRAILIASISNLAFKTGIVAVGGNGQLTRRVAASFGVLVAISLALIVLWPG
ncbi:MAG: MgtC/SapB family protein [Longimicrobiales bacterium]